MRGGPPEVFASGLRMQAASLSWSGKSLVHARVQGNLEITAVPRQMRRLLGPCGGAVRQDVLAAKDADANPNGENDFAA